MDASRAICRSAITAPRRDALPGDRSAPPRGGQPRRSIAPGRCCWPTRGCGGGRRRSDSDARARSRRRGSRRARRTTWSHIARGTQTRVVVNDRLDVALACGADGVHLRGDSIPAAQARRIAPAGFLIGRSVHAVDEASCRRRLRLPDRRHGVFVAIEGAPARRCSAWTVCAAIVRAARVPVLAIGGVTPDRFDEIAAGGRRRCARASACSSRLTARNRLPNIVCGPSRSCLQIERPAISARKLRDARERRGISLRQIANATKISVGVLEALERNDISRLPGGIFSRAFVRSYAIEVGLDPEATIQEFIAQFPNDSVTAGHPTIGPDRRQRSGRERSADGGDVPVADGHQHADCRRGAAISARWAPRATQRDSGTSDRVEAAAPAAGAEAGPRPPAPVARSALPAADRGRGPGCHARRARSALQPRHLPPSRSADDRVVGEAALLGVGDRRRPEGDRTAAAGRASGRRSRCGARWC